MDPMEAVLLRAAVDAVLADWAWHLDHGDYAAVAGLFTEDALLVTGAVELRGRPAIERRYTERERVRTTRHTYSGLRVSVVEAGYSADSGDPPANFVPCPPGSATRSTGPPRWTTSASTWSPTSTTC